MTTLELFFSSSIFLLFFHIATGVEHCSNSFCRSGQLIRFPFRLKDQNSRCGYPGFNLSCNNRSQAILNIPDSGDFTVRRIDYEAQTVLLSDPEHCLPKRLLNFTAPRFPFYVENLLNFTFFNCTDDTVTTYQYKPISCLSGNNYSVCAIPSGTINYDTMASLCRVMKTVLVPMLWSDWSDHRGDIQLMWKKPDCGNCEKRSGTCGFKSNIGLEIGCFNIPKNGLPRSAKYGIIIGVGIPGLLCIIGFASYACGRVRAYWRRRDPDTDFSTSIAPQSTVVLIGLDGPTIESYPKTMVGESRRLPKPNDNTCPICLAEYQPKETLRTIPECNHYFHVNCIDEWLKMNATCPLCRNSPDGSSVVTPSSSSSSSSLLSSS